MPNISDGRVLSLYAAPPKFREHQKKRIEKWKQEDEIYVFYIADYTHELIRDYLYKLIQNQVH